MDGLHASPVCYLSRLFNVVHLSTCSSISCFFIESSKIDEPVIVDFKEKALTDTSKFV